MTTWRNRPGSDLGVIFMVALIVAVCLSVGWLTVRMLRVFSKPPCCPAHAVRLDRLEQSVSHLSDRLDELATAREETAAQIGEKLANLARANEETNRVQADRERGYAERLREIQIELREVRETVRAKEGRRCK